MRVSGGFQGDLMTGIEGKQYLNIPYVDVGRQHRAIKNELLQAIAQVLEEGKFVLGPQVGHFECDFSGLVNVAYSIGVNSGTDAMILALRSLGVGPGDEVLTAVNSFVSSASAIALVGAKPVLVDVRNDYNIDPSHAESLINRKTKAIVPVHLTGRPAPMDEVMGLALKHNLFVIEDAAQAVCARYRGQPVGSFGHANAFSLHPLKTLNACGDGGVLTTNSLDIFEKVRELRNLGLRSRENCVEWSSNSRLDTIQAAMLLVKLKHLPHWTERRRENAALYRQMLQGLGEVVLPDDPSHIYSVYHTFVVQVERREALRQFLAKRGIGTQIHYPMPIHLQDCALELGYRLGDFPVAEKQAARILSLPIYPELGNEELQKVADAIRAFYRG
jgi:dTDP-4-amino-4,6-dideoxygalactose transaminase